MATLGATVSTTTFPTGSGTLEVKEIDGAPDVSNVTIIRVTNGTLTDDGGGQVTLSIGGGSNHDLLDGTVNQDTVAQVVSRGSLIYGNATPKWDELVIGAASTLLKSDGTDASWGTVNLLSAFHGDTLAGSVARGDLIVGNSTPKWSRKAIGAVNSVLVSDGSDPSWDVSPRVDTIYYEGRIIPTNIAAQADNYNPVDSGTSQSFHDVMQISMAATGAQTITGFDAGGTGEPKILTNRGTSTITLAHASGSSSANNQIWCPNATNYSLKQKASVYMYYSQPDNKWVLVATEAGSAGSNALLDGSVHSDTVAQTVSRGSLVYGNSTPAWDELVVGGADTYLKSDGTDVSWVVLGAPKLFTTTLSLNTSQLDNLNGTPIQMVAAQGAGKVVCPVAWYCTTHRSGAWTGSGTFRLQFTGSTTNLIGNIGTLLNAAGAGTSFFMNSTPNTTSFTSGFDNTAVEVTVTSDLTPGAQTGSAEFVLVYAICNVAA